jgi:hypothetical protein
LAFAATIKPVSIAWNRTPRGWRYGALAVAGSLVALAYGNHTTLGRIGEAGVDVPRLGVNEIKMHADQAAVSNQIFMSESSLKAFCADPKAKEKYPDLVGRCDVQVKTRAPSPWSW